MSKPVSIREVSVGLDFGGGSTTKVGRLGLRDGKIYFEYDPDFIAGGREISPLNLPLAPGLTSVDALLFEGLPGVFDDSLPDGWGRLLYDRILLCHGVSPKEITALDRLSHVGRSGMGALVYEPDQGEPGEEGEFIPDLVAKQTREVLDGEPGEVLEELEALNGSSGGARPKALVCVDASRGRLVQGMQDPPEGEGLEEWIVKFPNTRDGVDAGAVEYVYALMAIDAGVDMTDVHLFPSREGPGYFGTRRFDRDGSMRRHMHTACGILHSSHRVPSLDYENLVALTGHLTQDGREVERLFRMAAFNVLAHNRDDHGKNFSFLMDETGQWRLAPAYDLTFSHGPREEQSTMVVGEGRNPTREHLVRLGEEAKLDKKLMSEIIDRTLASLSAWPKLAAEHGVRKDVIQLVSGRISPK